MSEEQNKPQENLPAVNPIELPIARKGMFGVKGTGDTSGYGGLVVRRPPKLSSPRPYGGPDRTGEPGEFDVIADELERALGDGFHDAVERVVRVVDVHELLLELEPFCAVRILCLQGRRGMTWLCTERWCVELCKCSGGAAAGNGLNVLLGVFDDLEVDNVVGTHGAGGVSQEKEKKSKSNVQRKPSALSGVVVARGRLCWQKHVRGAASGGAIVLDPRCIFPIY